ncbi:hypothetical protein RQP46_003570 [Phenoliferia psychrophenolica]
MTAAAAANFLFNGFPWTTNQNPPPPPPKVGAKRGSYAKRLAFDSKKELNRSTKASRDKVETKDKAPEEKEEEGDVPDLGLLVDFDWELIERVLGPPKALDNLPTPRSHSPSPSISSDHSFGSSSPVASPLLRATSNDPSESSSSEEADSDAAPSRSASPESPDIKVEEEDDDDEVVPTFTPTNLRSSLHQFAQGKPRAALDHTLSLLHLYAKYWQSNLESGKKTPSVAASLAVAKIYYDSRPATAAETKRAKTRGTLTGAWWARKLRSRARYVISNGEFPQSHQGRGAHHESALEVEGVREAVEDEIERLRAGKELLSKQTSISLRTTRRWLGRLGYGNYGHSKDIYYDGHEREDVKGRREEYIATILGLQSKMNRYELDDQGKLVCTPPTLEPGEKQHILVHQDESTVHSAEKPSKVWRKNDEQELRSKSDGRLLHVSAFVCEASETGFISLTPEQAERALATLPEDQLPPTHDHNGKERSDRFDSRVIIYPGAKGDPYWIRLLAKKGDESPLSGRAPRSTQVKVMRDPASYSGSCPPSQCRRF